MDIQLKDHNRSPLTASTLWVQAVADPGDIATGRPLSLWCTTAGTATLVDEDGTTVTDAPFEAGQVYPISPTRITSITDAVLWLLY